MLSFIMPAKNAETYIQDAIAGVINLNSSEWELIIIEDHSSDDTYKVAKDAAVRNDRISVYKNAGCGKVEGLNFGYSLTSGDIIKCIDADDIVNEDLLGYCDVVNGFEVMCHNYFVMSADLKLIGISEINESIINDNFVQYFKTLKSIPRWNWTFSRNLANLIFPMPENLPYEDIWFSLIIKKHATIIHHVEKPLYVYRQHGHQTYGGVLNYNRQVTAFRARRNLKLINELEKNYSAFFNGEEEVITLLEPVRTYFQLLASNNGKIMNIITGNMPATMKVKLIVMSKLSFLIPVFLKIRFKLTSIALKKKGVL